MWNNFVLKRNNMLVAQAKKNWETHHCEKKTHGYLCDSSKGKILFEKTSKGVSVTFLQQNFSINFPILGFKAEDFIIPSGEGLYIPRKSNFWKKQFHRYSNLELTMPFVGIQYESFILGVYTNTLLNTQIHIKSSSMYLEFYRRPFQTFGNANHKKLPYKIMFYSFKTQDPLIVATYYKSLLKQRFHFVTLKDKAKAHADVKKLFGAFHLWVFGDAVNDTFVKQLQKAGIKKAWLGYQFLSDKTGIHSITYPTSFVNQALKAKYLVGPYVTFSNYQNPKHVDDINSYYPLLNVKICIRKKNQSIKKGFAGRGCYVSSQFFAKSLNKLKKHIQPIVGNANSIFIDVDGTFPFFNDYSKTHPMNNDEDLINRQNRLKYFSKSYVVGTETALGVFHNDVSFTNGVFLVFAENFWPLLRNHKNFGIWWPPRAPKVFFKHPKIPASFIQASYNPVYRLPLYQAVFHESVVTTDRWELNLTKIPSIIKTKILLQVLYVTPPIWVMDKKNWKHYHKLFIRYYNFFSPIHEHLATHALVSFQWLQKDHQVQQTTFDDGTWIIANFSLRKYDDKHQKLILNPRCVAYKKPSMNVRIFCP